MLRAELAAFLAAYTDRPLVRDYLAGDAAVETAVSRAFAASGPVRGVLLRREGEEHVLCADTQRAAWALERRLPPSSPRAPGITRLAQSKKDLEGIRALGSLTRRMAEGAFVAEGERLVRRALEDGLDVAELVCTEAYTRGGGGEVVALALERGVTVTLASAGLMAGVTDTRPLPPVLARVELAMCPAADMPLAGEMFILVLDGVANPDNLGLLLRTADGGGADAVVLLHNGTHYLNKNVVRGARGAVGRLPVYACADGAEDVAVLDRLAAAGFTLVGTSARAAEESLYTAKLMGRCAVLLGSESSGVRPEIMARCGERVRIPMAAGQSSLNVAVAAGVMVYERARRLLCEGQES